MSAELIYRRVPVGAWTDFVGLSDAAIVLAMRLRTGPETMAIPGLVVAGRAGLAEALGWPVRRLDAASRELEERALIKIDWRARTVWLPSAVTETAPPNPNVVTGWRSAWAQLPASELRDQIRAELWAAVGPRGDAYRQALTAAIGEPSTERFGKPFPPTVPGTIPLTVGEIGSGSGGGVGKGGGGGAASAPLRVLEDPDPDLGPALTAFRTARDLAVETKPTITTAEPEADVAELRTAVLALSPAERALVGRTASVFFLRDGKSKRDTWWSGERWTLHLFATQGIKHCLPDVKSGISLGLDGWPDGYDEQPTNRMEQRQAEELRRASEVQLDR